MEKNKDVFGEGQSYDSRDYSKGQWIRKEQVEVPEEDYNEDNDYGFGMKAMTLYAGYIAAIVIGGLIGWGLYEVFLA